MRLLRFLPIAILWFAHASFGQLVGNVTPAGRIPLDGFMKWDEVRNEAIVYRHQLSRSQAEAPVEVFDLSTGAKRTLDILKDFPQASKAIVSDVAFGNGARIVVACRLKYPSSDRLKQLILTYEPSLTLEKIWDVAPYEPRQIAVDGGGNVYSLGIRTIYDDGTHPQYGILVVYDSEGRVVREMLPRTMFPPEVDPAGASQELGTARIQLTDSRIFLYLPRVDCIIQLNKDGTILNRVGVREAFSRVAQEKGYSEFFVREDYFSSVGELWAGLILAAPPERKVDSLVVQLERDGNATVRNEEENRFSLRLAGVTFSNQPLFRTMDESRMPSTLQVGKP